MKREKFEPKINIGKPTQKQIEELREPTKEVKQEAKIKQDIPEKKSSINKIIGADSLEEKQAMEDKFAKRFEKQKFSDPERFSVLKEIEIEKTPKEIEIIDLANKETDKLLEKHNLPKFDIPAHNVHLLAEKNYYEKIRGIYDYESNGQGKLVETEPGCYAPIQQCVFLNKFYDSDLYFATNTYHELSHFKQFQSCRCLKDESTTYQSELYQSGLRLELKFEETIFRSLNEGLNTELEKRFYKNVLRKHPFFRKKIKRNEKIIKKLQDESIKSIADDIFEIKTFISKIDGKKTTTRDYFAFGYVEERKILNTLIEKLYSKNKDKFNDKEQVFDLFVKSAFTGKLNWGGLVNRTFGKGTFKKLAHLDANVEEMAKFVDAL